MMKFVLDLVSGAENVAIVLCLIIGLNLWNKAVDHAKENTENEKVKRCLDEIDNAFETAVKMVNQTLVDPLKYENNFDGTAQEAARNEAKEIFLKTLSAEARGYLYQAYADIDTYIRAKTEAAVANAKNEKKDAVLLSEGVLVNELSVQS